MQKIALCSSFAETPQPVFAHNLSAAWIHLDSWEWLWLGSIGLHAKHFVQIDILLLVQIHFVPCQKKSTAQACRADCANTHVTS